MTYANPVNMVREVVDKTGHNSASTLTVDFLDRLPIVHVYMIGGTEDFLERADRIGVDIYAPAPTTEAPSPNALDIAEELSTALAAAPLYTAAGTVDESAIDQVPVLRPYLDTVDVATMTVLIIHRPID